MRAADQERDEEVTAEEWQAFIASLRAGANGEVDPVRLKALILAPMLDFDDDGIVTIDDVMMVFDVLDRNSDASIAQDEFPGAFAGRGAGSGLGSPRRRRATLYMASLPIHAADVDGDGAVTEEEWWPFIDGVEVDDDGALADSAPAAWWAHVRAAMADKAGFTQGSYLEWIEEGLDSSGDGALTLDDIQLQFERLDTDGNGVIVRSELAFRRESSAPSEGDRDRPALMPWQRSLDDALALVETTGKPLLICVNMDGEMASESFAFRRYRDPEFVELVRSFVPLLVSPNRRNPIDHDDRGRRILDEKFGRLINAEHMGIESVLYKRYFDGRRVAPRHLAVDAQGNVLFDIFLENDLSKVDRALREHGVAGPAAVDPASLSEAELHASPDAGHRAHLEAAFLAGDERTRVRLASLALSDVRRTQHPQLLRLALADPAQKVRVQALWTIAQHPEKASLDFFVVAFSNGAPNPSALQALLGGLRRVAQSDADEERRTRARRLHAGFVGLKGSSEEVDVERWRVALSWAPVVGEEPPEPREALLQRLAALEQRLDDGLDDPELNLAFAAATMRYAQLQIRDGRDPRFLLEDVVAAAGRATSSTRPSGRALAFIAWASYLLFDLEAAGAHSAQATRHMLPWAGSPLAARALGLLADARTRAVYARMEADEHLPAAWIADVRAAHAVLLVHQHGTEDHALAYLRFLHTLEALGEERGFLLRALQRFPVSGQLHAYLRSPALRTAGIDAFTRIYEEFEIAPELATTLRWYQGLALLVAAERHVQNHATGAALAAYGESVQAFRESIDSRPDYEESSDHYVCLALSGAARLHLDDAKWGEAIASLREGVAASPASLWTSDGLGNTPVKTARLMYRSLVDAGRKEEARNLQEFLGENGLKLEPN